MTNAKCLDARELIDRMCRIAEERNGTYQLKSTAAYVKLIAQYLERVIQAAEEGKHVVAHTAFLPVEIFYAMDVVPLFVDMYCVFKTLFEDCQKFLNVAAEHGRPAEICSIQRSIDAMAIIGDFPKVDSIVYANMVCDNTMKAGQTLAELLKVPAHFVELPYTSTPRNIAFWKEELEGLVGFLEAQTGRKIDHNRLREVVRLSYRATELCQEINDLRKAVPCPLPAEAVLAPNWVNWVLAGLPEAVRFLEQLRDELKERVAKGIGAVPRERFRIIYPSVYPVSDMELMEVMEQRYGAVMVMDVFGSWQEGGKWLVDPADPLGNLAFRSAIFPPVYQHHGPLDLFVEDVVRIGREYRADGAIFWAHIGCRQQGPSIRAIKDELKRQLGIPSAVINLDIIDKAFISRQEVLDKLDGFFEMLEDSR